MVNTIQPRDQNGWRIPRKGTLSREVYDLFIDGNDRHAIAETLKKSPNTIGVLINRFQNPDQHNESSLKGYKNRRRKAA